MAQLTRRDFYDTLRQLSPNKLGDRENLQESITSMRERGKLQACNEKQCLIDDYLRKLHFNITKKKKNFNSNSPSVSVFAKRFNT